MRRYKYPREVVIRYIEKYDLGDYKESPDGKWINVNSIYADDERYCMGFNVESNWVHDFKLQESWSLEQFVAEHQGIDLDDHGIEVRKFLSRILMEVGSDMKTYRHSNTDMIIKPVLLGQIQHKPDIKPLKSDSQSYIGQKAYQYLADRGFGPSHIEKFNLTYSESRKCHVCHGTGYDEDDDKCIFCNGYGNNPYYGRIIIPTYENGDMIYYQGRTIYEDNKLRYMNPRAPRLQVVYFYDQLRANDDIYITEGPMDAMMLYDYSATCMMSMHLSDPQILKIAQKNPRRVIFVPDYDETQSKRDRTEDRLKKNIARFIKLTDGKIPIAVYRWYKAFSESELRNKRIKDINDASITEVDETFIEKVNF